MFSTTYRPLGSWPASHPESKHSVPSPFKASTDDTYSLLDFELEKIEAKDCVVEVDFSERELRKNRTPFANAPAKRRGVILRYRSKDGRNVTIPVDKFHTWQENLRAIALTLRALRAVDRYGATSSGEQYRGWQALPSVTSPTISVERAATYVASFAGAKFNDKSVLSSAAYARDALRSAFARTHPDKHMGDVKDFQLVGEAKRILQAHHGVDL